MANSMQYGVPNMALTTRSAISVLISTFSLASSTWAQWWVHERLVEGLLVEPYYLYAFVSPSGVPVYRGGTETGGNVFVGRRNFSLEVLGVTHSAFPYGVTDDGRPIWEALNRLYVGDADISSSVATSVLNVPRQSGRGGYFSFEGFAGGRRVFVNETDVTTAALGPDGVGRLPSAPNSSGQVAWRGRPAGQTEWDLYVDDRNVSSFLGPGREIGGAWVDEAGHVFWSGKSALTGNRNKAFLDNRDLTTEVFGIGAYGGARGMNRRGDVLWIATSGPDQHVMLNTTNVSFPVVGGRLQLDPRALSEEGHVLWSAFGPEPGRWRLFRDSEELNTNVIGFGSAVDTLSSKMNATGHVLWAGGWTDLSALGVYYDSFNLSRDAFGLDYVPALPLAIGDGGHCLWFVERGTYPYATYDVYLSTPVPEPGGALVTALGFLGFLRRARRSA